MIYTKDQLWPMSADEAVEAFYQRNIEAHYNDGVTRHGLVVGIFCASNKPYLPCDLKLANNSRSIALLDENLLYIRVL